MVQEKSFGLRLKDQNLLFSRIEDIRSFIRVQPLETMQEPFVFKSLLAAAQEQVRDLDLLGQEVAKTKGLGKTARQGLTNMATNLRVSTPG